MKYNSIGEQLIAKAQELDPNYKPDKFNDMSEALDVILNNSGGDIWLDITSYLNEDTMSISQEGYDLLYNGMMNNKYCGITVGERHFLYYTGYVGNLFFEEKIADQNAKSYLFGIYKDLHATYIENPFTNSSGSGSGFNLYDYIFNLDGETFNSETMSLTEVGLNKLNDMFVNGKLLGVNDGDPVPDASNSYFSFYRFLARNSTHYKFSITIFQDGHMEHVQMNIERQTGAVEFIDKILTATDA